MSTGEGENSEGGRDNTGTTEGVLEGSELKGIGILGTGKNVEKLREERHHWKILCDCGVPDKILL